MYMLNKHSLYLINQVVRGQNLSVGEAERVFADVFLHDKQGYHLLALSAAIHAKRETSDEMLGLCMATKQLGEKIELNIDPSHITDLSGTGGGAIKTINVSTAASFVVAAAGYTVAKQAYFGVTSPTGSADVFKAFGIDIYKLTVNEITHVLKSVGICPYFYPAISPKLKNRGELWRKIFVEEGVRIMTPFHLVSFAYSPIKLANRVYGCYSEEYLELLGELFYKLGNARTLVFHGVDGLPEMSNVGQTVVVEQNGKKLKKYTLVPKDFGLKKAKVSDIKTGGKEQNIIDFVSILYGQEQGAKRDLVLANASASLYVMGKVGSFCEGTKLAQNMLKSGKAAGKLEKLIEKLGNTQLLEKWKMRAEIL